MSSLIPSGGASGTGSVTLLAPNTNSTQTITLPDATGIVTLTNNVALQEADQWRITSNTSTGTATFYLTANWERNDSDSFQKIGTGMTQSSGVFTFPSKGIWLISFNCSFYYDNAINATNIIGVTTNNSTYSIRTYANTGVTSTAVVQSAETKLILNVTDTTQVKVKFGCTQDSPYTSHFYADTNAQFTGATFLKLGS